MLAVQSYTLPPDKLVQAIEFAHARTLLHFSGFFISVAVLLILIRTRIAPRMRARHPVWIIAASMLVTGICDVPAEMYGHSMSLRYHISIQQWPSWFWDWTKAEAVSILIAVAVFLPFYALLRRSPGRWWLYAWLISIPVMVVSVYADPLILDPLFNHFAPLGQKHPELIEPIEKLLARGGVRIPSDHLFEMDASEKTNSLNAYFTGFGPSSRMVLYDTIINKENGPPLFTTIGHELGHYALHHIEKGLTMGSLGLLATLWLLFHAMPRWIRKYGAAYDIRSVSDWSSLPLFLVFVMLLSFIAEPIGNAYSRFQEHQADVYSLEVAHGIIPDVGQAAANAFQIEGETDLEDPYPSPLVVFWLYSHPPITERLRFSLDYNPWKPGVQPEFVK